MHLVRTLVTACMAFFTVFSTVTAETRNILVGNKGRHEFDPDHVNGLKTGDSVVFYYDPRSNSSHVLFESTFANPCSRKTGGYGPINKTASAYRVNNPDAVYFYSSTDNECKLGMAFAINSPNSGAFIANAMALSTLTSTSDLNPIPIPSTVNTTSAASDLRISIQKVTGLAGVALLVGSLT